LSRPSKPRPPPPPPPPALRPPSAALDTPARKKLIRDSAEQKIAKLKKR
jgi:hypothetical protein